MGGFPANRLSVPTGPGASFCLCILCGHQYTSRETLDTGLPWSVKTSLSSSQGAPAPTDGSRLGMWWIMRWPLVSISGRAASTFFNIPPDTPHLATSGHHGSGTYSPFLVAVSPLIDMFSGWELRVVFTCPLLSAAVGKRGLEAKVAWYGHGMMRLLFHCLGGRRPSLAFAS